MSYYWLYIVMTVGSGGEQQGRFVHVIDRPYSSAAACHRDLGQHRIWSDYLHPNKAISTSIGWSCAKADKPPPEDRNEFEAWVKNNISLGR
jgi:hypothetical protein